ncbi:50S ribosomal protein L30 [Desulfomonile tiedjei]|uniref:50S ribosomal protein L30 n=1 Tax=Desulfomonile tiedjei (strain ATCC 49306 / DSM 6799 / DCB-1) TaxID=706587 RepID=I4CE79_DESTA|nr:50S ribosomal protein L30 [Desulfomonile tiedjei]AFM27870.1 LSU ribosomal protein L30P [Desulfomonile tiedjei DSM 6799]
MLKVTLIRSKIKSTEKQLATVRGLGLRKVNQSRVLQDTAAIRGMIDKVSHLVQVEEVAE